MHYESDRGTGPNGDGRLDLKIAGCDLVSGAGHILLRGLTDRLDKIAFTGEGDVRPDAEQCRYCDALEQRPGVEIDLRHAPTPLAASGLDMRVGHPAASMADPFFPSEVLKPRRRLRDAEQD